MPILFKINKPLKVCPTPWGTLLLITPMLLKLIKLKRGAYNKLISIILKFFADRGGVFSLAFRLLNMDIDYRNTIPHELANQTTPCVHMLPIKCT